LEKSKKSEETRWRENQVTYLFGRRGVGIYTIFSKWSDPRWTHWTSECHSKTCKASCTSTHFVTKWWGNELFYAFHDIL